MSERRQQLLTDSYLHVSAVVQSVVIAGVIAVLVGIAVYRSPIGSAVATGLASTVLTLPSFALLGLLIPILGLGVAPTVTALVLYGLLPIIRNTIIGLASVDPAITDAARGVGMNRLRVLTRIEMPLAWPSILAGSGSVRRCSWASSRSRPTRKARPGQSHLLGLSRVGSPTAVPQALTGTVLIVILALVLDGLLVLLGRLTTSRGFVTDLLPAEERTGSGVEIVLDDVVKQYAGQERPAVDHVSMDHSRR